MHNFGKPRARKDGRNPAFPYVPIINYGRQLIGRSMTRTEQIRGKAFETPEQAAEYAGKIIEARKLDLAAKLADPRYRALRDKYGIAQ
jgi:hypothetical protein